MMELLQFLLLTPYMRNAVIFLVILSVSAGVVGSFVTLRGMEFNAEAMVHSIFPGLAIGLAVGGLNGLFFGASVMAAITTVALSFLTRRAFALRSTTFEAGTAVVLSSFYGLGITFSLAVGDYSGQLEALMFGRLLDITPHALWQSGVMCALAGGILLLRWPTQVACAFDPESAQAHGTRVWKEEALLNSAIALLVVAASSAVGVLLVIGFLAVPGLAAKLLSSSVRGMIAIAVGTGCVASACGLVVMNLPLGHQVSPQAAVSLSLLATSGVLLVLRLAQSRWKGVPA